MAKDKPDDARHPPGISLDPPPADKPKESAKPKFTGDPELKLIARIAKALAGQTPKARKRIAAYLADRLTDEA